MPPPPPKHGVAPGKGAVPKLAESPTPMQTVGRALGPRLLRHEDTWRLGRVFAEKSGYM